VTGPALVVRGDALHLPLPDESVDLIMSSPPYFALRSYRDGDEHYAGQLGSEPTPQAFLEALWAVMAECWRVLKPTGSCFINLGDKRSGSGGGNQDGLKSGYKGGGLNGFSDGLAKFNAPRKYNQAAFGRAKSKMLLPHRFAIGCEDGMADPGGVGWIVRSDIVWCLSGGTKVYARTPTGARPVMLRDLHRSYQPEDVQLWNGEKWTQVLGWSQTPAPDDALELELRSGERIGCTTNHQWPTQRGLLRADEMRVGDVIETTRLPEAEHPRQPAGLDDCLVGWFIGIYIAEGSRSEKVIQIAGHKNEHERLTRLREIAEAFDGSANIYPAGENGCTINLSGAVLRGILDRYVSAGTAHTKRLTVHAWQRSDAFLAAVVQGYLDGDGGYDAKNDRWRLGFCANDEWAADLRTLAARIGASLSLRRSTYHGYDKDWPGWSGEWRWGSSSHWNVKPRGQVVAIRQSRARHFYDVGVHDEPHLFALASGVLTHNSKLNGLPESVNDRCRDSHEYLFHLTKQGRYFAAVDEIRTEAQQERPQAARARQLADAAGLTEDHRLALLSRGLGDTGRQAAVQTGTGKNTADVLRLAAEADAALGGYAREFTMTSQSLGKLPGSVWALPSEPLIVSDEVKAHYDLPDHFAAFPTELARRVILGWSPSAICTGCGEGRRPAVAKTYSTVGALHSNGSGTTHRSADNGGKGSTEATITGYACSCATPGAATKPSRVLDIFGGTGTTAGVARALGRTGISVDLSHDYSRLADYLIHRSRRFAKVINRTNRENQGDLFGVVA